MNRLTSATWLRKRDLWRTSLPATAHSADQRKMTMAVVKAVPPSSAATSMSHELKYFSSTAATIARVKALQTVTGRASQTMKGLTRCRRCAGGTGCAGSKTRIEVRPMRTVSPRFQGHARRLVQLLVQHEPVFPRRCRGR